MNQTLLHHVEAQSLRKKTPNIEAGMSVKISQKIKEGEKERLQAFEGLVIAVNGGKGISGTFTVRKIVGGIGVEKVFPLHGTTISRIEILKKAKVRRSKLYHMRELRGKAARMSETHVREVVADAEADAKAEAAAKKAEEDKAKSADEAKQKAEVAEDPTTGPKAEETAKADASKVEEPAEKAPKAEETTEEAPAAEPEKKD